MTEPGTRGAPPEPAPPQPPSRRPWLRPLLLLAVVAVLLVLARVLGLGEMLGELQDWIEGLGPVGPVVFLGLYILAVVAAIPGAAITLAAGALFGTVLGVIVVSAGSTVGATLAFLIARYFARDAVGQWASRNEKFARLDRLTERHGAVIVAVTRLVPLFPFNLLNYGFGLTRVRLWTYVFWSWLCMLPATVVYVAGADVLTRALTEGDVPWPLVGVLAAVLVLTLLLARYMRGYLKKKELESDGNGPRDSAG